jgi:hypothetical protein
MTRRVGRRSRSPLIFRSRPPPLCSRGAGEREKREREKRERAVKLVSDAQWHRFDDAHKNSFFFLVFRLC